MLDPFAGEAVKGIVASLKSYPYTGVELRAEQVAANNAQADKLVGNGYPKPQWYCGDSSKLNSILPQGVKYDLIFTSPPYYDLEIYSKNEKDGSTFASYSAFLKFYKNVICQAVEHLADNRFIVLKLGEVRNNGGGYHNFVGDNLSLLLELGLTYYNEIILITPFGTAPIRAKYHFPKNRKVAKTHQNIIVFYKGDLNAIRDTYPAEHIHVGFPE